MNRILTIAALALFVFARLAVADDGGEKRPEPKGDDGKVEGKDGKCDEKKDREAKAWAEKKAAEHKRWQEDRKKCERDGHHRCGADGRKACKDKECSRKSHKGCQDAARAKCKGACEEIRVKAKKEKGMDGDEKKKVDAKPDDIVPGGKKAGGDGDCKKAGEGDGKCDKECDGKEEKKAECGDEKKDCGDEKEEGADEKAKDDDGMGDLK
ncbi:MAG: hypothetical protein FD180_1058 [Planctomycetota bacterium]|nr:MAG: hypothetical protein FD180_1058 [Planctomycetota bacterium]